MDEDDYMAPFGRCELDVPGNEDQVCLTPLSIDGKCRIHDRQWLIDNRRISPKG